MSDTLQEVDKKTGHSRRFRREAHIMARITHKRVVCLFLVVLSSWWSTFGKDRSSPSLYGPGPERWVFSRDTLGLREGAVRAKGYDTNSVEALSHATKDKDPLAREGALYLLARKARQQAVPTLKQALDDPWPGVRCAGARLMGVLGDQSGLGRMRKDLAELTREDQKDDSSWKDRRARIEKGEPIDSGSKDGRLRYALDAADVLAEFGDSSGYELTAQVAVQNKSRARRTMAIAVLAKLGRIDKATLQARGWILREPFSLWLNRRRIRFFWSSFSAPS
jgi:HEAT repeats